VNMPKSYAVIQSSSGVEITISGDPHDWNNRAWRLATDSDPSERDPAEAVRLAEQTVAAEPKNADYFNTLGVARYRAKDFAGSIDALKHSIDGRGPRGHDAFFMAMAYARLGNRDEAVRWYATANRWMRQNDSNNAELKRFREEAVAVLDMAGQMGPRMQTTPNVAAASKKAAPLAKPK